MIVLKQKGDFKKIDKFLAKIRLGDLYKNLNKYGQEGVDALASATPVDSGLTAASWGYEIHNSGGNVGIVWTNNNQNRGVYIAIILQYGHGTGTGGYVQGRDYINPAIQPVFDRIADDIWKEVTQA